VTHWKPKFDGTVEDLNLEPKGNQRTLKWSELEKMFRCEGEDRLIDKIKSDRRPCRPYCFSA
jgi:hypothetical protein